MRLFIAVIVKLTMALQRCVLLFIWSSNMPIPAISGLGISFFIVRELMGAFSTFWWRLSCILIFIMKVQIHLWQLAGPMLGSIPKQTWKEFSSLRVFCQYFQVVWAWIWIWDPVKVFLVQWSNKKIRHVCFFEVQQCGAWILCFTLKDRQFLPFSPSSWYLE